MTIARIFSAGAAAALIVSSGALAQQPLTGTITGINRLNDMIAIKQTQNGTVGANAGEAAEQYKVQKGQSLENIHAGDRVSFSATTGADGTKTITNLKKQ
jgi:Cu/Ag efflux protein CusF